MREGEKPMSEFLEKLVDRFRVSDDLEDDIDDEMEDDVEEETSKDSVISSEAEEYLDEVNTVNKESAQRKTRIKNLPPNKIYTQKIEEENSRRKPFGYQKPVDDIIPSYRIKLLLRDAESSFSKLLREYVEQSKKDSQEICDLIGMDRSEFSRIRNDATYSPDKNSILALVVALELSLEETKKLLKAAGYALSKSLPKDLIVAYFIKEKQYNIDLINKTLDKFECGRLDV